MTQQEIEKCFDFPISIEKSNKFVNKIITDGWKLDNTRWLETESIQFYKGMYATIRIIHSVIKDQDTLDIFTKIGLDCLCIIHKLNEMSKIDGNRNG